MRSGLQQRVILNQEVSALCVNAEGFDIVSAIDAVLNRKQRLRANVCRVDNKGVSRIKRVHFKRRVVFSVTLARKDNAIANTANHLPFDNLTVFSALVFKQHEVVQSADLLGNALSLLSANILNRLAYQIARLESHNFIGVVFNNLVADFRAVFLDSVKDRLIAVAVIPEILDFTAIAFVHVHRFLDFINDVTYGDLFSARLDHTSAKHCTRFAIHIDAHKNHLLLAKNKKSHD